MDDLILEIDRLKRDKKASSTRSDPFITQSLRSMESSQASRDECQTATKLAFACFNGICVQDGVNSQKRKKYSLAAGSSEDEDFGSVISKRVRLVNSEDDEDEDEETRLDRQPIVFDEPI